MRKFLTTLFIATSVLAFAKDHRIPTVVDTIPETKVENVLKADKKESQTKPQKLTVYHYEFVILPTIARSLEPSEKSILPLSEPKFINDIIIPRLGLTSPVNAADIKVDVIGKGEKAIIVWTMPEPDERPLACMIAFVPANGMYHTWHIEKAFNFDDDDKDWVLGTMNLDNGLMHQSIKFIKRPESPEKFVKLIKKNRKKDAPSSIKLK